ncbi:hypothetical protein [Cytobacillus purgationiresistens]|uniref:Uncharacterized protein n=1 Tax=Cytobacillus purgationiresistens TaxID=863449 RepID=A0ABU0AJM3_9BACI|nr:hypothetical protein [Cytobacillus purgationiresistens]MDQ0271466.1 hypothetical protein [Cytobacillus purgationiresistens]
MVFKQAAPPWFALVILALSMGSVSSLQSPFSLINLVVPLIWINLLMIKFELSIFKHECIYKIKFFKLTMYTRTLLPVNITAIRFMRSGWNERKAIIHTRPGFNIRILLFEPLSVFTELNEFADRHSIDIHMSKGYSIVEKSYRLKQESIEYEIKRES